MASIAEELVISLRDMGVRHVFGIPGGPSIPYMEAMRKEGVEFVLVSNEQSAGMMADVCGRLTGVPGVCHATFGPGATNLTTGVGGALLDRSPLIALTTEVKAADLGRKVQMNIDHQALYRPITKWTTRLSKDNFRETISQAFRIATAEVPGPVHIGLPSDIDGIELEPDSDANQFNKTADLAGPDEGSCTLAARLLQRAQRPVLAVGLTAARLGLHQEIRRFVDRHNIPVLLTPMAKGVIPDSHPCFSGVLFHAQSDRVATVYRQADLVIGLGYDSIEFNYESWMPQVPLVHIDTTPADLPGGCAAACEMVGDLASSVRLLNAMELPSYQWDLAQVRANREIILESLRSLQPATDACSPVEILTVLQNRMPKDGILTADVGAHLHLLGQLWSSEEPGRFIMTNGWSGMGFGIPAAIGAKICRPDKSVVCVTGDGGFLMNCGELLTARRLGINIVFVVLCDRNLSLIEVKQGWRQVAQYGTELFRGEYFAADRFLGVPVLPVHDGGEMKKALQTALGAVGPVIIEAWVDGSIYKKMIVRSYK